MPDITLCASKANMGNFKSNLYAGGKHPSLIGDTPMTRAEVQRRYRERHPERIKDQRRRYRSSDKHIETRRRLGRERLADGRAWASLLSWRYGTTVEKYEEMFKEQNGGCKLCGKPPSGRKKRLCVDHVHDETGTIRGLLCDRCNQGIGHFGDDPILMTKAVEYVRTNGRG